MRRFRITTTLRTSDAVVLEKGQAVLVPTRDGRPMPATRSREFGAGVVIAENEVLPGCLASLVRLGQAVELPPEPAATEKADEPKKAKK